MSDVSLQNPTSWRDEATQITCYKHISVEVAILSLQNTSFKSVALVYHLLFNTAMRQLIFSQQSNVNLFILLDFSRPGDKSKIAITRAREKTNFPKILNKNKGMNV
jgi:hypothetical protein